MAATTNYQLSPPTSFHVAFQRLGDLLTEDDARSFASTTLHDVWTAVKDLERQLESRKSLRGFHRIQPLLSGIEKYSGVVEVLCQGTPYLPYLWKAPIKILLQIAQGHISALEKLVDAYAMIGEAIPRFDRLSAAFKDDLEFQHVMGHFYADILEFHRRSYKFFRRRAWKMVFESLWKTFNLRFQGILESLRRHRDLIDQEANAINIAESKVWRDDQLSQIRQWRIEQDERIQRIEKERLATQTRDAIAWLNVSEDQDDVLTKLLNRYHSSNTHWALEEGIVRSWLRTGADSTILWLNGKPGSGKSILCSKMIEHVQGLDDTIIIYYFCSHQQHCSNLSIEILRSLTAQLLAIKSELAPYIVETFANNGLRPNKKSIGLILEKLIVSLSSVRIVIDGLDECSQSDQEEILDDLLRIRGPTSGMCKVLFSSRKVPSVTKALQTKAILALDDHSANIDESISTFVNSRLTALHKDFPRNLIEDLGKQILAKANGMFLWVRLVMCTLEDLYYEKDLRDTIDTLPEELGPLYSFERLLFGALSLMPSRYERIIERICGNGRTANQRTAIRILQWILVAKRPLKRYELISGIILDHRNFVITTDNQARGDPLSLCGPLLEVDDGHCGSVNFFHFTVIEYLKETSFCPGLQLAQAELAVSLSCVLQLTSGLDLVDPDVIDHDAHTAVAHRLHDLQLYATEHWCDHLLALSSISLSSCSATSELQHLSQAVERLTQRHNALAQSSEIGTAHEHRVSAGRNLSLDFLDISASSRLLIEMALYYHEDLSKKVGKITKKFLDEDDARDLLLRSRTRYQSIVEELSKLDRPNDKATSDFQALRGLQAYLCRYPPCVHTFTGFPSAELREEHEAGHTPRYHCTHASCGYPGWTYRTSAALRKHVAKYHDKERGFSVPDRLSKRVRHAPTERSLFLLRSNSSTATTARITHKAPEMNARSTINGDLNDLCDLSTADVLDNLDFEDFPRDTDTENFHFDTNAIETDNMEVDKGIDVGQPDLRPYDLSTHHDIQGTAAARNIPPLLPPGWSCEWSDRYSQWYYINDATERSQWEKPVSYPEDHQRKLTPEEYQLQLMNLERQNKEKLRMASGPPQDYQAQINLLDQQNKKRLLKANADGYDPSVPSHIQEKIDKCDAEISRLTSQRKSLAQRAHLPHTDLGPIPLEGFILTD